MYLSNINIRHQLFVWIRVLIFTCRHVATCISSAFSASDRTFQTIEYFFRKKPITFKLNGRSLRQTAIQNLCNCRKHGLECSVACTECRGNTCSNMSACEDQDSDSDESESGAKHHKPTYIHTYIHRWTKMENFKIHQKSPPKKLNESSDIV
jgi:hypothetical protein